MPNNNQEIVITSFFDNPYDINNKTLSYEIPVGGAYIIDGLTQVNSDWLATDGLPAILNKPILADVATSGDYDDLHNKPILSNVVSVNGQIGDVVLTAADVGAESIGAANAVSDALQPQIDTLTLTTNAQTISIATKADQAAVDAAFVAVNNAIDIGLAAANQAINTKASQTDLDALDDIVVSNSTAIGTKADVVETSQALATKATVTALNQVKSLSEANQLNISSKVDQVDFDALSVDVVSNTQTLLTKADIANLTTLAQLVGTKADQAYVVSEIARITGNAPAALDTLAEIAEQLGNDQTQINNLLNQIGNRVRFDAAQALTAPQQTQVRDNINAEAKGVAQSLVSSVTVASIGAATTLQGTKADSALQPNDVSTAGKTGNYNDLSNKPDLSLKQDKLPTTGTTGQFLAHDLTFKTPTSGSTVNEYSSTALASAWTGTNPSTLSLTITGLLASHKTVLDVDLSSVTFANIDGVQADYALIYRAVPTANTLTLYASKKPTKDLALKLVVLNG